MAQEEKTFLVPVVFTMYGRVPVRAKTAQEALKWACENGDKLPLPQDAEYLEESFEVDFEGIVLDEDGKHYL